MKNYTLKNLFNYSNYFINWSKNLLKTFLHLVFDLDKKILIFLILFLIGVIQYYYLLGYNFSFYYASADYIDATNRMFDLGWPIISNNTANTRTWFYPFILKIFGSGSLNFLQIIFWQNLLTCFFPCIIFLVLINLNRELKFNFIFCLILSISCCLLVFSRTLLNEVPYIILTSLFCVLSLVLIDFQKKILIFLPLIVVCFFLLATRPTGIVFSITLIFLLFIYFRYSQINIKLLLYSILFIFLVIFANNLLNKKLNSDYTSGAFIFSTINIIPYLGNKHEKQLKFDPININSHKQILQLMSDYETTYRGIKAQKKHIKKININIEKDSCKFLGTKLSSCFLMYANLETYWQAKWIYINKFGLNGANKRLKELAFETIINDPIEYFKIFSKNFFWFLVGTGGGKNISYERNEFGPYLKNNNHTKFFTRYIKKNSETTYDPFTIKIANKLLGKDYEEVLNKINSNVNYKTLDKKHKNFRYYFTPIFNITWLLGIFSGMILILMFSINLFSRNFDKLFREELIIGACLFLVLIGHAITISLTHPPLGRYLIPLQPISITLFVIICRIILIKYKEIKINISI
jgi:hypothetical protein|tara:strand:- start:9369 stop:11105 length:1737 start_codon:yes stop_codon:yes gene_type:complete